MKFPLVDNVVGSLLGTLTQLMIMVLQPILSGISCLNRMILSYMIITRTD